MLVSGVALGVLAGLVFRRSWRPLSRLSVRLLPLLILAIGLRAVAPALPAFGLAVYVAAMTGTVVVALANWRLPGAALIALGGLLNLAVVLANAGMPVEPSALVAARADMPIDRLHVIAADFTVARPLADAIPVALFRSVYSIGDFGIAIGGFLIPFVALVRR